MQLFIFSKTKHMEEQFNAIKEVIRKLMVDDGHKADVVISFLKRNGYSDELAKTLVYTVANEHKEAIIERSKQTDEKDDRGEVGMFVIFAIGLAGPVFGVESEILIFAGLAAVAITAYFAFPTKPISAVIAAIVFVFAMFYAHNWYLRGRTSYINIEMVIPMAMAAVPSIGLQKLLDMIIYPGKD